MKKIIFLLLLNSFVYNCTGQIAIGGSLYDKKQKPLKKEILKDFMNSTTVFITRTSDNEYLADYLKQNWTITPLIITNYENIGKYLGKIGYSIFEINGLSVTKEKLSVTKENGRGSCMYVSLLLKLNRLNKKNKIYQSHIAKMELHIDIEPFLDKKKNDKKVSFDEFSNYMYKEADIYNWNTFTLSSFLKLVNDSLAKNKQRRFYIREHNLEELKNLRKGILYVPEYILKKFNVLHGTSDKEKNTNKLFEDYPYEYKVVSNEEFEEMYISNKKTFYYLSIVKSCNKVLINIIKSSDSQIIYSYYPKLFSYNVNPSDIKRITKLIEK